MSSFSTLIFNLSYFLINRSNIQQTQMIMFTTIEMETSYKITDTRARSSRVDLDIDAMIQTSGLASDNQRESKSTHKETNSSSRSTGDDNLKKRNDKEEEQRCSKANRDETTPRKTQQASKSKSKTLSYGDSSSSSDSEA